MSGFVWKPKKPAVKNSPLGDLLSTEIAERKNRNPLPASALSRSLASPQLTLPPEKKLLPSLISLDEKRRRLDIRRVFILVGNLSRIKSGLNTLRKI